ncbi:MAG: hypothetical protein AB7O28_13380 [Vicinamibacterales bacterium]
MTGAGPSVAAVLIALAAAWPVGPAVPAPDGRLGRRQDPRDAASPGHVDVLRAVDALPVEIVGRFREPLGYERLANGDELVFDRRGHTVYAVPRGRASARALVSIGGEDGRVIEPSAFDARPDGTFAVADAPRGRERIQIFRRDGSWQGGFLLRSRATPRVTVGGLSLSGVGTMRYTGSSLLVSEPETGGLMVEYGLDGTSVRTIGRLRTTGHEADRDLHLAMNAGVPIKDPRGGYWFVFLAGEPAFSRFDADGALVFHRRIQGRELDPVLDALPSVWPRRTHEGAEIPLVSPTVRTAALDPAGRLWISLVVPYTYVFDGTGEKIRTVQFQAAGLAAPNSLSFPSEGRALVTPGCFEFDVR